MATPDLALTWSSAAFTPPSFAILYISSMSCLTHSLISVRDEWGASSQYGLALGSAGSNWSMFLGPTSLSLASPLEWGRASIGEAGVSIISLPSAQRRW